MKRYFILGTVALSFNLLNAGGIRTEVDIGPDGGVYIDDGYYDGYYDGYDDGAIWVGPGYYYGDVWFNTEGDYYTYRREHRHGHHKGKHHKSGKHH